MEKQFKDVEQEFGFLKNEFRQGRISRREFIERLKKLRMKDSQGRFWMIGAQSGQWYYYDGEDWIQSRPPPVEEGKAICIHCGFENRLEAEVCTRCGQSLGERKDYCPRCGRKLEGPSGECPQCSQQEKIPEGMEKDSRERGKRREFVFHSLNPVSLLFFLGVAGIFAGILLGAVAGVTDLFYAVAGFMPFFLRHLQGTLVGGVLYAILGGLVGFVVLGAGGFLLALFINFISSFVGGVKMRLD
ncbi:MAG: double zinc ribbon domain-containing protein [Candidatus Aminicenantes bacterium]